MGKLAVFHKSFLIKILLGAVRTRRSITVWDIPWLKGCILGGGLHTFHDVILVFGTCSHVRPDLGWVEVFRAVMARSLCACAVNLSLELQGSEARC